MIPWLGAFFRMLTAAHFVVSSVQRDGEAMDFDAEPTKAGIVEVMLREMSRDTVLTLRSVKQTERFLHLDSWAAQHPDEEKARASRPAAIRAHAASAY